MDRAWTDEIERAVAGALRRNVNLADWNLVAHLQDGRIEVHGVVDSWVARMHAIATVQRVARGLPVVNHVRVRLPGSGRGTDDDVHRAAMRALRWHALVPERDIVVHASHGWVRLCGSVDVEADRWDAESAVLSLANVLGVTNELEVSPARVITARV